MHVNHWRNWISALYGVQVVGGSNPLAPTKFNKINKLWQQFQVLTGYAGPSCSTLQK